MNLTQQPSAKKFTHLKRVYDNPISSVDDPRVNYPKTLAQSRQESRYFNLDNVKQSQPQLNRTQFYKVAQITEQKDRIAGQSLSVLQQNLCKSSKSTDSSQSRLINNKTSVPQSVQKMHNRKLQQSLDHIQSLRHQTLQSSVSASRNSKNSNNAPNQDIQAVQSSMIQSKLKKRKPVINHQRYVKNQIYKSSKLASMRPTLPNASYLQSKANFNSVENLKPQITLISRVMTTQKSQLTSKRNSTSGSPFQRSLKRPLDNRNNSREKIEAIINTNHSSSRKLLKSQNKPISFKINPQTGKQIKITLENSRKSCSQDKTGDISKKFSLHDRLNSKFVRKSSLHNNIMSETNASKISTKQQQPLWKRQSQQSIHDDKRKVKFLEMQRADRPLKIARMSANPYNNYLARDKFKAPIPITKLNNSNSANQSLTEGRNLEQFKIYNKQANQRCNLEDPYCHIEGNQNYDILNPIESPSVYKGTGPTSCMPHSQIITPGNQVAPSIKPYSTSEEQSVKINYQNMDRPVTTLTSSIDEYHSSPGPNESRRSRISNEILMEPNQPEITVIEQIAETDEDSKSVIQHQQDEISESKQLMEIAEQSASKEEQNEEQKSVREDILTESQLKHISNSGSKLPNNSKHIIEITESPERLTMEKSSQNEVQFQIHNTQIVTPDLVNKNTSMQQFVDSSENDKIHITDEREIIKVDKEIQQDSMLCSGEENVGPKQSLQDLEENRSEETSPQVNISVKINLNQSNPYLDNVFAFPEDSKNNICHGTTKNDKEKKLKITTAFTRQMSEINSQIPNKESCKSQTYEKISELKQKDEDNRDQQSIALDIILNREIQDDTDAPFMVNRQRAKKDARKDNIEDIQRLSYEKSAVNKSTESRLTYKNFIKYMMGGVSKSESSGDEGSNTSSDDGSYQSNNSSDESQSTHSTTEEKMDKDEKEMQEMLVKSIEEYLDERATLEPESKRKQKKKEKDKSKFDTHMCDLIEDFINKNYESESSMKEESYSDYKKTVTQELKDSFSQLKNPMENKNDKQIFMTIENQMKDMDSTGTIQQPTEKHPYQNQSQFERKASVRKASQNVAATKKLITEKTLDQIINAEISEIKASARLLSEKSSQRGFQKERKFNVHSNERAIQLVQHIQKQLSLNLGSQSAESLVATKRIEHLLRNQSPEKLKKKCQAKSKKQKSKKKTKAPFSKTQQVSRQASKIFQSQENSKVLDDIEVPSLKSGTRVNSESKEKKLKLKVVTGEEKYPFRTREEPKKVVEEKKKELPQKVNKFDGILNYLAITQDACSEIMNIIHYIADNNIENTSLLDRMCRRALKQIDELIGPHQREFQEVRYLNPKIVDKIRRILLKKLICIYENQNSIVQLVSDSKVDLDYEDKRACKGMLLESNILISKINKQLTQAQEIYGFFMKNQTLLYRKHGREIRDISSKEENDSVFDFIVSPKTDETGNGLNSLNGAVENDVPYLKPFNLDRYEKSDPEESESKLSKVAQEGLLTKTLSHQFEKGIRFKIEQKISDDQYRLHMINLYENKMAEGLNCQVKDDMRKRDKEQIHATILKKIEWQKQKKMEQDFQKEELKREMKALLSKERPKKKQKPQKLMVTPQSKSGDGESRKESPVCIKSATNEYDDNFNYTLNMMHPIIFTPAESRPNLTSAQQESQYSQIQSSNKDQHLVMVTDQQLGSEATDLRTNQNNKQLSTPVSDPYKDIKDIKKKK